MLDGNGYLAIDIHIHIYKSEFKMIFYSFNFKFASIVFISGFSKLLSSCGLRNGSVKRKNEYITGKKKKKIQFSNFWAFE